MNLMASSFINWSTNNPYLVPSSIDWLKKKKRIVIKQENFVWGWGHKNHSWQAQ